MQDVIFLTGNLQAATSRIEVLEGVEYLVVPMVMMCEGVHSGSEGSFYYPAGELGKTPSMWNLKPIVVYHPEIDGKPVSACNKDVLEKQKVGIIMNATYDNKLRAEAWLQNNKIDEVDPRIRQFIEQGRLMEVSTGVFLDIEPKPGVWSNEKYDGVARNHRPDHLALLPDKVGACSIADGGGLLQVNAASLKELKPDLFRQVKDKAWELVGRADNEASHGQIRESLYSCLRGTYGEDSYCYIEDVYSSFFVYEHEGQLYLQGYSSSDSGVSLVGQATSVSRVYKYLTADGKIVGNNLEEPSMAKTELVDGLIAHKQTNWKEEDRVELMKLDEKVLEKMAPLTNSEEDDEEESDEDEDEEVQKKTPAVNVKTVKGGDNKKVKKGGGYRQPEAPAANAQDLEGYLANLPPAMASMVRSGLAANEAQKTKLIETIMSNENNTFEQDFLLEKDVPELEAIAKLAERPAANEQVQDRRFRRIPGPAPTKGPTANAGKKTGLKLPRMDFSTPKS